MSRARDPLAVFEADLTLRGCSPRSFPRLLGTARRFLFSLTKSVRRATSEDVRRYLAARASVVSARSHASELSHLRSLFRALLRAGLVTNDPTESLSVREPAPRPQLVLEADAVQRLLAAALEHPRPANALRDRACVELLYGLGLRAREVSEARVEDVQLAEGTILVRRAKRGKPTFLPLPSASLDRLALYLREGRAHLASGDGSDDGRLVLNDRGRPVTGECLHRVVQRIALRAGVRASPHALRRSLATHLARAGVNVEVIRQVLGHARLSTTARYVEVDREDLLRAVRALELSDE